MTTTMMMTFPLARLVFSQQPCIIHCSFLDGQDLFHLATLFRIALCAVRAIEQNFPNKSRDIVLPCSVLLWFWLLIVPLFICPSWPLSRRRD